MGTNISKGNTNKSTRNSVADLPDPLVANIISQLPIQSIVRCRKVCKAWLRLISGIDFNYIYQKKGIHNTYMPFIVITYAPYLYSLFELNTKNGTFGSVEPVKPVKLNYNFGPSEALLGWVGCCNGLICIVNNSRYHSFFYIWNPVLGEYISFPNPRDSTKWYRKRPLEYYGFGYCPVTKEYKILKAERDNDDLEVITIGPNTAKWRSLWKTCCYPRRNNFHYLNGVIHWICTCCNETNSDWIHCFDCETEQRLSLHPPRDCLHIDRSQLKLAVLRNRLCLLLHFFDDDIVLWVMENYGVAESWMKQTYHNQFGVCITRPIPLILQEDNDILFLGPEGSLCYYDYDKKQYVNTRTTLTQWIYHGFSYIPSFIPLLEVFKTIPWKMPIQHSGWLGFLRSAIRLRQIP